MRQTTDTTQIGINLAIAAASLLLVFAGLELALRTEMIQTDTPLFRFCDGPRDKGAFHPVYGWTEYPGQVHLEKWSAADDWSRYRINEKGFRDIYTTGEKNVIVLGDSFTRGTLVDQNATFSFLLDAWSVATAFHAYTAPQYGTTQEYVIYRDIGLTIPHKAVVLAYYLGNDAKDNVDASLERPWFELVNGTLRQTHQPVEDASLRDTVREYLYHNLAVIPLVDKARRQRRNPPTAPVPEETREQLSLTRAVLTAMAEEAGRHNATFFTVIIPERGEVNPDRPAHLPPEEGDPYWNAQRRMIQRVAAANDNMQVLDLTPALQQANTTGIYGRYDAHLDDAGHRIAATQIYNELVALDILSDTDPDISTDYTDDAVRCP